jgi:hypothetical protein
VLAKKVGVAVNYLGKKEFVNIFNIYGGVRYMPKLTKQTKKRQKENFQ